MSLKPDDVKKIAHLAQLNVAKEELAPIGEELNKILALVAEMDQVDTSQIKPLSHPYDETQPLRTDEITETNQRELFQSIAPKTQAGLYLVPQVIDNE